jgi:hypothetical protein
MNKQSTDCTGGEQVPVRARNLTPAQKVALLEVGAAPFVRCREGWKTAGGRFVPLIVVAKLRKAGLVILDAAKRTAKPTLAAAPVLDYLSEATCP